MSPSSLVRSGALLSAAMLAGCASYAPVPTHTEAAFVVLGENGQAIARVITAASACPPLQVDGHLMPMRVRVPLSSIPARAGQPHTPPSSAVLTCEAPLPAGAFSARAGEQVLPVPKAEARRIVVIGDTGCRLKGKEFQDCNDPQAYPFARVAASAAAFEPDLVIHVGDYHYREDPCPGDRPGCAGSPYGYGYDAWAADFFTPAKKLLAAAPWVVARGNHENCSRGGQGWWRYLDPRPFETGRDCDAPANDGAGDYSDPYAVPLGGGAQLIVFDSANTNWKGLPHTDPRRAKYADTYRKVAQLAQGAAYNIAVDHHPLLAFGANRDAKTGAITLFGGDKGLLDAFGDVDAGYLPRSISMLLSGHVHLWEQLSFASPHPTQFVAGFSGTSEDIVPLPASVPPGQSPAPGAVVEAMSSWIDGFGFMTMERSGPDAWQVVVWDRDGKRKNSCSVKGRRSRCELAQVK